MPFVSTLVVVLTAATLGAPSISVAPIAARGVGGTTVEALSLLLPTELRKRLPGASIVSAADLAQLLGVERQKELVGCSEASSSCLMELANAVGTGELVAGSVGRLGSTWVLELQRLDLVKQQPRGSATRTVKSEEELIDAMRSAIAELYPLSAAVTVARPLGVPVAFWGAGAVLLAAGVVGLVVEQGIQGRFDAQQAGGPSFGSPTVTRAEAQLAQVLFPLSLVSLGLGAASVAVGVWRFGAAAPVSLTVRLLPGGAFATVGARF